MKERTQGLLTGAAAGIFSTMIVMTLVVGGLGSGAIPFPLTSNSNYTIVIYIYHSQNGSLQVITNKAFIPSLTMSGNDDFGTPLGDCKLLVITINGLNIQYHSVTYAINPHDSTCGG